MKRLFKTIMLFILLLVPITIVNAKTTTTTTKAKEEKAVTMYVFYGKTCPHCQDLEAYVKNTLRKNEELAGKFEVKYYEVWYNQDNSAFMQALGMEAFNYNVGGVPFFIIGDKYFSGYGETMNESIEAQIKNAYENGSKDLVAEYIKKNNPTVVESNPEDDIPSTGDEDKENENTDIIGYVIIGITLVIVLAIVFTRGSSSDYVEITEDDEKTSKKTTTTKIVKKNTKKRK